MQNSPMLRISSFPRSRRTSEVKTAGDQAADYICDRAGEPRRGASQAGGERSRGRGGLNR